MAGYLAATRQSNASAGLRSRRASAICLRVLASVLADGIPVYGINA
ncbi:MAG: hypothetical protein JWM63_3515 [Gammaproteobacteria bacterium]|jgi:hypothetical protein|nr:hypothetical protein [Gammaproteobacteria bacterium]